MPSHLPLPYPITPIPQLQQLNYPSLFIQDFYQISIFTLTNQKTIEAATEKLKSHHSYLSLYPITPFPSCDNSITKHENANRPHPFSGRHAPSASQTAQWISSYVVRGPLAVRAHTLETDRWRPFLR